MAAGLKAAALTGDAASSAAVDLTAAASEADLIVVVSAVETEDFTAAVDSAVEIEDFMAAEASVAKADSTEAAGFMVEAADSMAAVEVDSTVVAATEADTGKTSKVNS